VAQIRAVLIHVSDVAEGLAWYQRAFPHAERKRLDALGFDYLDVGGVSLELVPSDEKWCIGLWRISGLLWFTLKASVLSFIEVQ
jgi:hypothetical protein